MIITFCLLVFAIVCGLLLLRIVTMADTDVSRKKAKIEVCVVLILFVLIASSGFAALIGCISGDFNRDSEFLTVTVADKWHENGHYYFSDSDGNVYKLSVNFWVVDRTYNNIPYGRHKSLVIGEGYQIKVYYVLGASIGMSLEEKRKQYRIKWAAGDTT